MSGAESSAPTDSVVERVARFEPELEAAVGAMTAAVLASDPAAAVGTCPGWDVAALVEHVVRIHRWAAAIVLTGRRQDDAVPLTAPADVSATALAEAYSLAGAALLAALRSVDPELPAWNFTGADQRVAFWWRRQLHEVTVHTADAVLASGGRPAVDPQVAADGIDEVLAVWPRRLAQRGRHVVVTAPVTVVATDTGDRWLLEPGDPYPAARHVRAGGDGARVTGPAAELYLRLWGRGDTGALTVDGDDARAWLDGPHVP